MHGVTRVKDFYLLGLRRKDIETLKQKHCVKRVGIRSFSGPYFPVFGLNTERCGVYFRIQYECGKIGTRKTTNVNTFYSVKAKLVWS